MYKIPYIVTICLSVCLSGLAKDDLFLFKHEGKRFYYGDFLGQELSSEKVKRLKEKSIDELVPDGGKVVRGIPSPYYREFSSEDAMYDYLLHHLEGLIVQYLLFESLNRKLEMIGVSQLDMKKVFDSYLASLKTSLESFEYYRDVRLIALEESTNLHEYVEKVRLYDKAGLVPDERLTREIYDRLVENVGFLEFFKMHFPLFVKQEGEMELNFFQKFQDRPLTLTFG